MSSSTRPPIIPVATDVRPPQIPSHVRHGSKAQGQPRHAIHPSLVSSTPLNSELGSLGLEENRSVIAETMMRRTMSQRTTNPASTVTSLNGPPANIAGDFVGTDSDGSTKRLDRSQSVRHRPGHSHHRSNSRNQQEQKTVGEYALHHLFTKFLPMADQKIQQCLQSPNNPRFGIEAVCGTGVDLQFDQLLVAMAHITRRRPRSLVDTIMLWRQQKAHKGLDAPLDLASPVVSRSSERRPSTSDTGKKDSLEEESKYQKDYRSAIVIYLTCRVLIEVFQEADSVPLPSHIYDRLESIVFERLQDLDPNVFNEMPYKRATCRIYAQILGVMSGKSLPSIAKFFIADLKAKQRDLYSRGIVPRELENKVEYMVLAMRHMQLRTTSETSWRDSCDFLLGLADLFVNSHGAHIKYAYCRVLAHLLVPLLNAWTLQLYSPKFRDFLSIANTRVSAIAAKPRHWPEAIGVASTIVCALPQDSFVSALQTMMASLSTKLKDRHSRVHALQAISKLVWAYLKRGYEAGMMIRRIDEIMKTVLPLGKKGAFGVDAALCDPLVELIRISGFYHPEHCFRSIIFPLINADVLAGREAKDVGIEQLDPERMVVGIRAFLAIVADVELAEMGTPRFPVYPSTAMGQSNLPASDGHSKSAKERVVDEARRALQFKPVTAAKLPSSIREYHTRFCEILGKIALICDHAFGGQASLDEKLSSAFSPKTPLVDSFGFGRRDDHQTPGEQRLGFYELLHVAVQALPRFLPVQVQLKFLINLLCTCTAHVQSNIAISSIHSLKAIAHQSSAQAVTIGFARFIFNFDARYSTMSEEGLLGPEHIESTLALYVELLQIWIGEIKQKTKEAIDGSDDPDTYISRSRQLELQSVSNHVDEVESHGLFFLCSQSRRVRAFAIKVLRIVTELDSALGRQNPRIISILDGSSQDIIDLNDETLSVVERSRLQKGKAKSVGPSTLVELSSSDVSYDIALWVKVFPNIIRSSFNLCLQAVILSRENVCYRLQQMSNSIILLDPELRTQLTGLIDPAMRTNRLQTTSPHVIVEQWKLYLIMACTTITNAGAQTQSQLQNSQHVRKSSKPAHIQGPETLSSARGLFGHVIPLMSAAQSSIREAIVIALSSINATLYRTLLESLQYPVTSCKEEAKQRMGLHQRSGSHSRRNPSTDRLRTEVTQVYRLTARFLQESFVLADEWILGNLSAYTKDLLIYLGDAEVQNDWECQRLRRQYCGLIEELFNGVKKIPQGSRYMSFEFRKSAFALMEEWCGYSPVQSKISQREEMMRQYAMGRYTDARERASIAALMETEKRDLSIAALSAMATLCAGPVKATTDGGDGMAFDTRRIMSWIGQVFNASNEKLHAIGQRALYNLIVNNKDMPSLLELSIEQCYAPDRSRALRSYFEVVTKVMVESKDCAVPFWRILAALIFLLGSEKSEVRVRSAKLAQSLEQRRGQDSKIQDFEMSISDKTTAVHKLASFEISRRLSKEHKEFAFYIFSQFSYHFRNILPDEQRQMVYAVLPWIQMLELQIDPEGNPTTQSYMLLVNLLEITAKSSGVIHNEVQALWKALATGHPGNVQLVLNFVIALCLERRDQRFVSYAKQIIVYMAGLEAGPKVIEFLMLQITPKNMVHTQQKASLTPSDSLGLPYIADISKALPAVNKQDLFSLSQLSVVFLVDLIVAPMTVKAESVPLLLHVIFILWDNQITLVSEQAREMLVHLIHELIITKISPEQVERYATKRSFLEAFVESVRRNDPGVIWHYREKVAKYEEWSAKDTAGDDILVPPSMPFVISEVIDIFSLMYPDIKDDLARTSLTWGTSCPVRHAACRSLQIFRCVLVPLDRSMLSDILARISNTVVHDADDVQTFSMEMLTTVKSIIAAFEPTELLKYPHLFWTTCACLDTVYEREFVACVGMLDKLLSKLNLNDPVVVKMLRSAKPARWQGNFEGIAPLLYKGLKSEACLEITLPVMEKLLVLPEVDLIGNHTQVLFSTLANLPRLMQSFEDEALKGPCLRTAGVLATAAEMHSRPSIASIFRSYGAQCIFSEADLLQRAFAAIREEYFPTWEVKVLVFVMGLLTNNIRWYKLKVLEMLKILISGIDTRRAEISSYGPDLISPLLRLLQTEFCTQAIDILDHIAFMAETPLTKQHMRMSMAWLGSRSLSVRKEYERTASLYGIPEESGWSIPMPAIHSNATRSNMQSIYQECANPSVLPDDNVPTPELEFHPEDDMEPSSYFPLERTETIETVGTVETAPEGGMDDLLSKLNSLDDFFDESLDSDTNFIGQQQGLPLPYQMDVDAGPEIYDQEAAPMLQQTLARSSSITSLHHSLADRVQRDAVTQPSQVGQAGGSRNITKSNASGRPMLHLRSVTTPVDHVAKGTGPNTADVMSDEESNETLSLSEDEHSIGQPVGDGSRQRAASSLRRGNSVFRKMISGSDKKEPKRSILKTSAHNSPSDFASPSLPKVPDAYF